MDWRILLSICVPFFASLICLYGYRAKSKSLETLLSQTTANQEEYISQEKRILQEDILRMACLSGVIVFGIATIISVIMNGKYLF